jgi:hypothetical protein
MQHATWLRDLIAALLVSAAVAGLSISASARPERIRAGHSYYSDGYVAQGQVHDIAEEKNYEEVYQSYRYYESQYDEAGRVVIFLEYVRGEVIRREEYQYGDEGVLIERIVRRPGREAVITAPVPDDAGADPGAAP